MVLSSNVRLLVGFCLMVAAAASLPAGASPVEEKRWEFRVFLDEREIGSHEFRISGEGATRRVESEARFDVRILFVNAYRYRHRNVETWNGDCLAGIDAVTDANGDKSVVRGSRNANGFSLSTGEGETSLPQCVMTFAYWNPEFLKSNRLVNPQTGEYEDVEILFEGSDVVEIDGRSVSADRYRIALDEGPITLWYSAADQRWLALESVAKGGRTLRYEPVAVPAPAGTVVARSNGQRAGKNDA